MALSVINRRRQVVAAALLAVVSIALLLLVATGNGREPDSAPQLTGADLERIGERGRYSHYRVTLRTSTGRNATGQLLVPGDTGTFPGVLLNNGRELDSDALRYLPPEFGNVVVLSLDYPHEIPYQISISDFLLRTRRLQRGADMIAPLFSLGGAYLASRDDVDAERIALVATSFAVPFAVRAAAFDQTFRDVALVYGAGDMGGVLAENLAIRPRALRKPVARLMVSPFRHLEPERWVGRISPRPLIMVNGMDDPQMPRAAVEALYEAASEPKVMIWMRTGHLMPNDSVLIRALVDTTLDRLPTLVGSRVFTPDLH
jgi:hypothetical protein